MVRPSPQTERLVEIIELLAQDRSTGRSLAELATHLDINKATLYPMLTELLSVGWLVRHPRTKLFRLGPRLVAVGRAAEESFDLLDLARPHALRLAQALDATAMIVSHTPNGIVVVDVAPGSAAARQRGGSGHAIGLVPGDTMRFRPPLGSVFAAWGDSTTRHDWLEQADPEQRPILESLLSRTAERGFAIENFPPSPGLLGDYVSAATRSALGSKRARTIQDGISPKGILQLIDAVSDDAAYHPVSINAPILDPESTPAHALLITDLELPVSGAQVLEIGRAVVETAALIMRDSGHLPPR